MQIAIVDDDLMQRSLLARALRRAGCKVVGEASDGVDALIMLRRCSAQVILTDCDMPRMDGIELVQTLRLHGDVRPILMISGRVEENLAARAIQAGANGFYPKPLDLDQLVTAMKDSLRPDTKAA